MKPKTNANFALCGPIFKIWNSKGSIIAWFALLRTELSLGLDKKFTLGDEIYCPYCFNLCFSTPQKKNSVNIWFWQFAELHKEENDDIFVSDLSHSINEEHLLDGQLPLTSKLSFSRSSNCQSLSSLTGLELSKIKAFLMKGCA